MKKESPQSQFARFLARYDPAVSAVAKKAIAKVRKLLPGALELVYDNYNALAIGFGPTDRASDAIVSVALYPKWASLFFLQGAKLADPKGLLKGSGTTVRHIVLSDASELDDPDVRKLIAAAVKRSGKEFPATSRRTMIIKSVSAKQRPRRPVK